MSSYFKYHRLDAPAAHRLDERGAVTHGHLAENNDHGGTRYVTANLKRFKDCKRNQVLIAGFTYLPGDLLPKADLASMASSLELRSPLLDRRVVELGLSLPDSLKVRGRVGKQALRRAFGADSHGSYSWPRIILKA